MRRSQLALAVAGLLVLVGLAGCIGDEAPAPEPANTAETDEPSTDRVRRYATGAGNGSGASNVSSDASPWTTLTGFEGAEPSAAATQNGTLFTIAFDRTLRSTDGGLTWQVVHDYLSAGGRDVLSTSDPWLTTYRDTVYTLHMYEDAACNSLFVSSDQGESWQHEPAACGLPSSDHPKLGVGPPGRDPNPLTGATSDRVLYLCYNKLAATSCAASYDHGRTWPVEEPIPHPDEPACGGINGPVTVGPDGAAVVPMALGCERLHLGVSTDSGLTWTSRAGPAGPGATGQDPGVAFAEDGTLYVVWRGDDQRLYLARTPDLGRTWEGPWRASPPGVTSTVFHTLEAGDPGRIAFAALGTDDTDGRGGAAPTGTVWHLYIVTSTDADGTWPTFTAYQVTPDDDPVQVGCAFDGTGRGDCRNMLDFINGAMTPNGSFFVAYTDGCVEDCQGGERPDQSTEHQAAIAGLRGFDLRAS